MRRLIPLMLLAAACSQGESRFRSSEDGFSIRALPGWTQTRDKGSVIFRGPEALGLARNTVVIRAVPNERVRPHARDPDGLARATASILAGLPASEVSPAKVVELPGLAGVRFEATFEPPGKDERYRRTQIALVGEHHVFHLMHTAPEEALSRTAAVFDDVAASFKELSR